MAKTSKRYRVTYRNAGDTASPTFSATRRGVDPLDVEERWNDEEDSDGWQILSIAPYKPSAYETW